MIFVFDDFICIFYNEIYKIKNRQKSVKIIYMFNIFIYNVQTHYELNYYTVPKNCI